MCFENTLKVCSRIGRDMQAQLEIRRNCSVFFCIYEHVSKHAKVV